MQLISLKFTCRSAPVKGLSRHKSLRLPRLGRFRRSHLFHGPLDRLVSLRLKIVPTPGSQTSSGLSPCRHFSIRRETAPLTLWFFKYRWGAPPRPRPLPKRSLSLRPSYLPLDVSDGEPWLSSSVPLSSLRKADNGYQEGLPDSNNVG